MPKWMKLNNEHWAAIVSILLGINGLIYYAIYTEVKEVKTIVQENHDRGKKNETDIKNLNDNQDRIYATQKWVWENFEAKNQIPMKP